MPDENSISYYTIRLNREQICEALHSAEQSIHGTCDIALRVGPGEATHSFPLSLPRLDPWDPRMVGQAMSRFWRDGFPLVNDPAPGIKVGYEYARFMLEARATTPNSAKAQGE